MKSSSLNYGYLAKAFHWITALGFLLAYVAVYYRHWFTERGEDANWTALQLHLSIGVYVGVLVLLRVLWKMADNKVMPVSQNALSASAAKWGHYLLYAVMIMMPVTGYMGTGVVTDFFFIVEIPKFEDTWLFQVLVVDWIGVGFDEFEKPIDLVHKLGGKYVVWVIIACHILAALYHHYVLKDRTLIRMTRG